MMVPLPEATDPTSLEELCGASEEEAADEAEETVSPEAARVTDVRRKKLPERIREWTRGREVINIFK